MNISTSLLIEFLRVVGQWPADSQREGLHLHYHYHCCSMDLGETAGRKGKGKPSDW